MAGRLRSLEGWKSEAGAAGRTIDHVVLTYEAGRDGFWIARALQARGIGVPVVRPASVPVPRRRRRAKTDRIDLAMLLRSFLAWLRGRPRVCSTVRVPSAAEADLQGAVVVQCGVLRIDLGGGGSIKKKE